MDQNRRDKRARSDFTPLSPVTPLKLHIDDDAAEASEIIHKQESVINSSYPFRPTTFALSRKPSEFVPTSVRPPMVAFPDVRSGHPLISPPMPGEIKWTSVMTTPDEPAKVDEGRDYSNGLAKWSPVTWVGVASLPVGTWLQYTTSVYPAYTDRKKVVCTVGDSRHARPGSVNVWSIIPGEFKAKLAHSAEFKAVGCLKGYHTVKTTPTSPFVECEHCPVKGWPLSPGNPSQDRRFYVSPWVLNKIN
jgi:hypothetical protein